MNLITINGLFIFSIILIKSVISNSCINFNSNKGATYDLTELVKTSEDPPYMVEDGDIPCTTQVEKNYTYIYNICGTVYNMIPNACKTITGLSAAAVLQIDKRIESDPNDDYCYIVGSYTDYTTKLELLDAEDPSKGLTLTYYGDYCNNPRVQRKFIVEMPCADRMNPKPTHAYEISHCNYKSIIPSTYSCPLECPVSNNHLCGGNGHCAYDEDKGAARCYCNKGNKKF